MTPRLTLAAAFALAVFLPAVIAPGAHATNPVYREDFTTTQYKDTLNTTAWWDTMAGELKLLPFVPTLAGTYDTPDNARGVAVAGDHAFVADGLSGLLVIDISDPGNPTLLGDYDTPDEARDVAVAGNHAFVADRFSGLQAIDISDPTNPTLLGSYATGSAWAVAVSGDQAFVATSSGLQVIDISDPTNPALLGSYATSDYALDVAVAGDHAFVAERYSGLRVIDITNPTNPALVGSYAMDFAFGVAVSGDHAFVADGVSGLQVIDIANPTNPALVGSYATMGQATGIAVSGDRAYVADVNPGLQMIDISDPTNPTLLGTFATPGSARGVAVSGDHAFVSDGDSGLQVIRVSFPANPTLAGIGNIPYLTWDVAVSGDVAFMACTDLLMLVDISDPAHPITYKGWYLVSPTDVWGVAVSGDHAFVAVDTLGLLVIDISDPTNPTLLGTCDTPGNARDVAVSGDHAYVADNFSGLRVIDITDPTHPQEVGYRDTPLRAVSVAVSGDHAFLAHYDTGLWVIDITDPTHPTHVGTYDTGWALDVAVAGDLAFVANGTSLKVIDISDPEHPTLKGNYDNWPGWVESVAVAGDQAFVTTSSSLQVIDISDPTNPALLGSCDAAGYPRRVAISGDYAFIAAQEGLRVIQVYQSEVDSENNVGRSLYLDASNDTILGARLLTTQTSSVTWELSADGGVNWQEISRNGSWNRMTVPGTDLLWRSTHAWSAPGVNPGVSQLEIGWLGEAAPIDSIVDAPDDQGRSVNLSFTRSGRDFLDETAFPVVGYAIYRRLDDPFLVQQVKNQPAVPLNDVLDHPQLASFGPDRVRRLADRTFIVGGAESTVGTLPPGVWEGVGWILPTQSDSYTLRVNTLVDSTAGGTGWSVFVTAVHTSTPSVWYVSEPDSGYSIDNIAPAVPEGFGVAYNTGSGNQLSWDPCPDADFQYFNVYRSSDPDFTPSPSDLVHSTTGTDWNDPEYDGWAVYYKVTALDLSGNESDPASAGTTTAVTEPVIPQTFGLYPNVPNPFNPTTSIRYDVPPGGGAVTLRIYDVSGKLVRTLVDGPQTAGQKSVTWNGRDNQGRSVASGVYFYRLQAPGYEKTLKMVLIQ